MILKKRSCAIVYNFFHCLAHHDDILKLLVNAIENVKPICEIKKSKNFWYYLISTIHYSNKSSKNLSYLLDARSNTEAIDFDHFLVHAIP